jgi:polysaccharide pyruvyl transferase WcaK-like protein
LNWATDRWHQRFATEERAHAALDDILNVLKIEAQILNARIYLIEHLMPNELNDKAKQYMRSRFKETLKYTDHCVVYEDMNRELYPPFDYTAPFFADIYRQMDFVMGMRGHANILSFSQNTPMIGLGEHNKVRWFLEDIKRDNNLVRLNKDTYENISDLRSSITFVMSNLLNAKNQMKNEKNIQKNIKDDFILSFISSL